MVSEPSSGYQGDDHAPRGPRVGDVRVTVRQIGVDLEYRADRATAERYQGLMEVAFPGARVVIDDGDVAGLKRLPCEQFFVEPLPREKTRCDYLS